MIKPWNIPDEESKNRIQLPGSFGKHQALLINLYFNFKMSENKGGWLHQNKKH